MRRLMLLLLLLSFNISFAKPVYLSGLYIKPSPTASRFIFVLSEKTHGRVKFIENPNRLMVEFANTRLHFAMQATTLSGTNVSLINTETKNDSLRFIFHVKDKIHWEIRYIGSDEGSKLQLDIKSAQINAIKTYAKLTSP